MEIYSKAFTPSDYDTFDDHEYIIEVLQKLQSNSVPYGWEHPDRKWEYGLTINALKNNGAVSILEIGGAASVFAPAAVMSGMDVTQVDLSDTEWAVTKQNEFLGKQIHINYTDFFNCNIAGEFDAVVCLSVIEHVSDDKVFFDKLLDYIKVGGLLILTTDFHPDGKPFSTAHHRTYNQESMQVLIDSAKSRGFEPFGLVDYTYHGGVIYDTYTFASLVLKRIE